MKKTGKLFKSLYIVLVSVIMMLGMTLTVKAANGAYSYNDAKAVLPYVNAARNAQGLGSLVWDDELTEAAMRRAEETTVKFSHYRPDGSICFTICDRMMGENLAYGFSTPKAAFDAWMNSAGHKANILKADYKSIGIGCFIKDGVYYWSQAFGYDVISAKSYSAQAAAPAAAAVSAKKETAKAEPEKVVLAKQAVKSVKSSKKGTVTFTWKKNTKASGYQVQVASDKKFKTGVYAKKINKNSSTKATVKNLTSKKNCYVRVRSFKTVNGTTTYGAWSTVKTKKVK